MSQLKLSDLPGDVLIHILCLLTPTELGRVSQTCQRLHDVVAHTSCIWRCMCLNYCNLKNVRVDRCQGYSWKECCQRSYGANGIRRQWFQGEFSSPKSLSELPQNVMCCMDTETWGEIFRLELLR